MDQLNQYNHAFKLIYLYNLRSISYTKMHLAIKINELIELRAQLMKNHLLLPLRNPPLLLPILKLH